MLKKLFVVAVLAAAAPSIAMAEGDVKKGEKEYKKCGICHAVGEGAAEKKMAGPHLNGIIGRAAGAIEGYEYSKDLKESGLTWDQATLDAWIKKPKDLVKKTKMIWRGQKKDKKRADLIAYLAQFNADGTMK